MTHREASTECQRPFPRMARLATNSDLEGPGLAYGSLRPCSTYGSRRKFPVEELWCHVENVRVRMSVQMCASPNDTLFRSYTSNLSTTAQKIKSTQSGQRRRQSNSVRAQGTAKTNFELNPCPGVWARWACSVCLETQPFDVFIHLQAVTTKQQAVWSKKRVRQGRMGLKG
jgi:hypothetical protein